MPGISVASVSVSVIPNAENFTSRLRSAILPGADALGIEVGRHIADGINAALRDIRVNATVDLDTSAARAALDDLGSKSVSPTVGLDDTRIVAALDEISGKLDHLSAGVYDVELELNAGNAVTRLDEISLKLDEIGGRDVAPRLGLDDSSFSRQLDEDMAKLDAAGAASASAGFGGPGLIGGLIAGGVAASPALPGVLAGGAATIGTLGLAVQGIMPALEAYKAKNDAAALATGKTGAAAISAASQIHSAQEAVSKAETQAAHDAVTSAESVKNAHTAVAQAVRQAANSQISAEEQLRNAQASVQQAVTQAAQAQISAEEQLANAQYAEKQAQAELTDARQQAILTLQQLHNAEADTALSAEQAQLDLEQAKLNLEQTDKSATATALQKAQADLSVREAEQRLTEAQQARKNAADASSKADKEGVKGLPAVVAAQHNLAQAHRGTADAQRNLTQVEESGAASIAKAHQSVADAQRNLATVEQNGAAAIAGAQQSLADAVRNASWQQQGDAQSVSDAQYGLNAAYATAGAGSAAATTAAAKYAQALAELSPAGREMVKDIIGLKAGFDSLKGVAQTAIAPGFTAFLQGVHDLLPEISTEVGQMGRIIGDGLAAAGQAFQSSWFQTDLKTLFDEGNKFLQVVGPAIGDFLHAFLDAGAKSAPAVAGLAQGIAAIVRGFGDLFTNLAPAAPAIGAILKALGTLIGALGGPLGTAASAILQALAPDIVAIAQAFASPVVLGTITGVVTALADLIKQVPPKVVADLAVALLAVGAAVKTIDVVKGAAGRISDLILTIQTVMTGGGAATAAGEGAAATGSLGLWGKILPGIRLAGGALVATVIVAAVLKDTPSGPGGKNWWDNPGGADPKSKDPAKQGVSTWVGLGHQIEGVVDGIRIFIVGSFQQTYAQVAGIADKIAAFVTGSWDETYAQVAGLLGRMVSFITSSWDQTYAQVSGIIGRLVSFTASSWGRTTADAKSAWNAVAAFFVNTWNQIYNGFSSIIGKLISFLSGSWSKMTTDAKNIWNGLVTWVTSTLPNAFKSAFQGIIDGISSVWGKLKDIAKVPINFIIDPIYDKGIVGVVNAVAGLIGMHPLAAIPKLAGGGKITQGTTAVADDVLARVSKNETVVSAEHSRQLAPIFAAVGVPGYAAGGVPSGNAPAVTGRFGPIPGVGGVVGDLGHMLAGLTGDALAAAAKLVLDPLLGAMPGGGTTLGAAIKKIPVKIVDGLVARLKGTAADGSIGGGSGADVAKYAASFATGKGHPYVWGGSSPGGWDCSGASAFWYEHFGYFPEHQGTRHGTSESQFTDPLLQGSGAVPGALAFFKGSGGAPPGHVGVVLNPKSFVSAYDTAEGTVVKPISGAMGYRIPKGGFQAGGGGGKLTPSQAQTWMHSHMGNYGWGAGQWPALQTLWDHESGWRYNAQNPASPAYGIPQADPGSKMASAGADWRNNAVTQMKWGAPYIEKTYGTPAHAWDLWQSRSPHWYDGGGWLPPGLSLTANGTGQPEAILTGRQWDMISSAVQGGDGGFGMVKLHKKFDRMIHLLEQAPGRTAGGVAGALDGTARRAVQRAYFSTR